MCRVGKRGHAHAQELDRNRKGTRRFPHAMHDVHPQADGFRDSPQWNYVFGDQVRYAVFACGVLPSGVGVLSCTHIWRCWLLGAAVRWCVAMHMRGCWRLGAVRTQYAVCTADTRAPSSNWSANFPPSACCPVSHMKPPCIDKMWCDTANVRCHGVHVCTLCDQARQGIPWFNACRLSLLVASGQFIDHRLTAVAGAGGWSDHMQQRL